VGAVDKGLGQVELASTFEVLGQTAQQSLEHALFHPALETPVAS